MESDEIKNLREALQMSPNNIPLRKFLADTLLKYKRLEEAELEYKELLKLSTEIEFKLGLANCFLLQKKTSAGLVLLEDILENSPSNPKAYFIYAKLLFDNQQVVEAKQNYDKAVINDHTLTDNEFEQLLNDSIKQNRGTEAQKVKVSNYSEPDDYKVEVEKAKVKFEDVGGMESIKEEIRLKIIHPLQHPEIYKQYGKKIGGGILLYGPPGCGKTHLARATAGEINANFIAMGINEILDLYLGESERNLHAFFDKARQLKPCVLFIDEVDALGANRTDMRHSAARQLINQFLSELDGIEYSNEGVLILAATNAPWHLDPAFRRPGRFDRILFVPPPDEIARTAIFRIMLKEKPVEAIDYKYIASNTPDYSGADIKAIVDIAIELKINESIKSGKMLPLSNDDLKKAIKQHKATTKEWFGVAKNYAMFANEAGLYDDILKYIKK